MSERYYIEGQYGENPWERVDNFGTLRKAFNMLGEYAIAFGRGWQFRVLHKGDVIYG